MSICSIFALMAKKKNPKKLQKKPLILAAMGEKTKRRPIWFMRQAGRYLPEYRAIRAKTGFVDLCKTPNLAAEITLQPIRRYDVDAAIIFADILLICTAMGQKLSFDTGHGPLLSNPIRTDKDLKRLRVNDVVGDLEYVGEAIQRTRMGLTPLQTMIGFAGAPFTVASYMIEGSGSKNFTEVKRLLYQSPLVFKRLLEMIAKTTFDYLEMQVEAGAETLMLFDSWLHHFSGQDFVKYVLPVTSALIKKVRTLNVPVIYYAGQGGDHLSELAGVRADVISVDWRLSLSRAQGYLKQAGLNPCLQGNLDPQVLVAPERFVRSRVRDVLQEAKKAKGHIFNVGHGLLPHTPPESLTWVIDEIRKADE